MRSINKNIKVSVLRGDADEFERVFDYINSVDKCFPIPLSERTDISVFTKKFLTRQLFYKQ